MPDQFHNPTGYQGFSSETRVEPTGDNSSVARDTQRINQALQYNSYVKLVPGQNYYTNAPLIIPPGTALDGLKGNVYDAGHYGATISPVSTWSQGSAPIPAVIILSGGSEPSIRNLNIDGSSLTASSVDGVAPAQLTNELRMDQVQIINVTGHGVNDRNIGCLGWYLEKVHIHGSGGAGFFITASDSNLSQCEADLCTLHGFYVSNAANTKLLGCRAEWSGQYGYWIDGTTVGNGGVQLDGCSTDRNGWHGVYVSATGYWPTLISNMMLRRDGRLSTTAGYAGLAVAATATSPVVVEGITNYPGVNDDGTGLATPQYGISVLAGATYVGVTNGLLHAITAGVNGTITNSRAIATRTGPWNAPTAITMVADSA